MNGDECCILSDETPRLPDLDEFVDAEKEDIPSLQEFADKHDVILLALIGTYYPKRYNPISSASATFNIRDEFGIEKILTEIKGMIPDFKKKKMFLLVNSVGGSSSSAYKISRVLRDSFEDITVFVLHYALSGGTLLALIGDRIRMGMMSQLSPLDVQINYKGQFVSVNSLFNAQNTLNKIFRTQKLEELPYMYKHLAESLDPIIIEEWNGFKTASSWYLDDILEKSKYDKDAYRDLSNLLLTQFPTHSFVIQYDLAKDMQLRVEPHDTDLESWNLMREWFSKYINRQTDRHFIRYVIPQK